MLSDSELLAWHAQRGTPERTRSVISHIRSTDPARRVGGGRCNVSGRYPSRKMGVTIQFESHRVELAAIYELEHDPEVLEYYDQPPAFKLDYQSASGRHLGILHTADYFVIRGGSAGWEECKTQEELVRYSERNANRYRTECDATWHCPPGETHAAALKQRVLEQTALSVSQCEKILAEARDGEARLAEDDETRRRLRNLLHLSDHSLPYASEQGSPRTAGQSSISRSRPGVRRPKRDPIGHRCVANV